VAIKTLWLSVAGCYSFFNLKNQSMKASRRNFLQSMGVGVASLGITQQATVAGSLPPKVLKPAGDDQLLFVGDAIAVANTEYGKVRGLFFGAFISF
jgi:para-nitrobenzyl esterase